jgi:AcrR family transcriptional regulator
MDKRKNKDSIIEVARKIFAFYGYRRATLDEIAAATGMGKSSIYYYFSCKEEVFRAVIEIEADIMKNKLLKAISSVTDPIAKFHKYVITRMEVINELANYYQAVHNDYLLNLDFVKKMRKNYDQQEVDLLRHIFQEGANLGVFRINDAELAALAVSTALKGLETSMIAEKHEKLPAQRIERILHMLSYGIVRR